jgi:hypothetical protein
MAPVKRRLLECAGWARPSLSIALAIVFASGCRTSGSAPPVPASSSSEAAVATRESPPPGLLPSDPLERDSVASLPSFQVQVMDFQRGEAAWQQVRAANAANRAPSPGSEYVVVRPRVTGVAPDSWVGCSLFRVVGAARIAYFHASQFAPAPALERGRLKQGELGEGWCVYSVQAGERDLLLMITDRKPMGSDRRYVALEPGAALAPAPIADRAQSETAGDSPRTAATLGQEVVTEDWAVTAVEVVRGDAARHLVERANPQNPPPAEGLEFVAVELLARYRGRTEQPGLISASQFKTIDGDGTAYPIPNVMDVEPRLNRLLLPGGEHTGWAVFQVAPGDARPMLRFRPFAPDRNRRYLLLVGGG